jgi:subtilase family serine protease
MRVMKFVVMVMVFVATLLVGQGASAGGLPELFLQSKVYTPVTPLTGTETLVIKNEGQADAGIFRVFVLDDVNAKVLHVFSVAGLKAGDSVALTYNKPCRQRERVVIDRDDTVDEVDEFNNIQIIKPVRCATPLS